MSATAKKAARRRSGGIPLLAFAGEAATPKRRRFEQGLRSMLKRDATLTAEQRADLERYLADPLKAGVEDMGQLLDERAKYRGGRTTGADRDAAVRIREHIRELRAAHPTVSAKELRKYADESILDGMPERRWANLVSETAPRRSRG